MITGTHYSYTSYTTATQLTAAQSDPLRAGLDGGLFTYEKALTLEQNLNRAQTQLGQINASISHASWVLQNPDSSPDQKTAAQATLFDCVELAKCMASYINQMVPLLPPPVQSYWPAMW